MKTPSLVSDASWRRLSTKSAGLLAGMALVALLFVVQAYFDSQRMLQAKESEVRVVEKVAETVQVYDVICRLNAGDTNYARSLLESRLSANLVAVDSTLPFADEHTREYAVMICRMISQRLGEHPAGRAAPSNHQRIAAAQGLP